MRGPNLTATLPIINIQDSNANTRRCGEEWRTSVLGAASYMKMKRSATYADGQSTFHSNLIIKSIEVSLKSIALSAGGIWNKGFYKFRTSLGLSSSME